MFVPLPSKRSVFYFDEEDDAVDGGFGGEVICVECEDFVELHVANAELFDEMGEDTLGEGLLATMRSFGGSAGERTASDSIVLQPPDIVDRYAVVGVVCGDGD